MANLIEIILMAVDEASGTISRVARETSVMEEHALSAGASMLIGGLAADALATALGKVAETGAKFQSFTQIIADNTTMTDAQLGQMRTTILAMSEDGGIAYEKLGTAFMKVMNITNDAAASQGILQVAMESAVATGGEVASVANVLANALHEYGLDVVRAADGTIDLAAVQANAAHVMGVMHLAAAEGNMTLEQFSEASGRAIGIAANLGVPLEDVSAGFAALTKHGFDAATAGTQMVNIMTHMINPTQAAAKEIKRISDLTGIDLVNDFSAAGLHSKGLEGVLGDLKEAYTRLGLTEAQGEQESMKLINAQRGGLGLATLLGTAWGDYNSILKDLNNTEMVNNITEDQYNKVRENAVNIWQREQQTARALAITIGTEMLPVLQPLLEKMLEITTAVLKWTEAHQELAGKIAAGALIVLALVGAVLTLGGAFLLAGSALATLAGALPYVAGALGVVGGLVAGAILLWQNFRPQVLAVLDTLRDLASTAQGLVAPALQFLHDHFLAISTVVGVAISALLGVPLVLLAVWTALKLLAVAWATDWDDIREKVGSVVGAIVGFLNDTLVPGLQAAWAQVKQHATAAWDTITSYLDGTVIPRLVAAWETLRADTDDVWMRVRETIVGAAQGIGEAFAALGTRVSTATQGLREIAGALLVGLGGAFQALLPILANFGNIFQGLAPIGAAVRTALDAVREALAAEAGTLAALGPAFSALGSAMRLLYDAANSLAALWRGVLIGALRDILPLLGDLAHALGTALVIDVGVGVAAIGGLVAALGTGLAGGIRVAVGLIELISGGITIMAGVVTGAIKVVGDVLRGDWHQAWLDAQAAATTVLNGIKVQVLGFSDVLIGAFQTTFGAILSGFGGFGATLIGYFGDLYTKATGQTLPWAATMKQAFQDLATGSINWGTQAHDAIAKLLGIVPQVGPVTTQATDQAGGGLQKLLDALTRVGQGGQGATATFTGLGAAALAMGGSIQAAAQQVDVFDKVLQGLNTTGGVLQGYLRTLQAEWDQLNVATQNGTTATAAQQAEYALLAPAIEFLNAKLGENGQQTLAATLAAVAHQQALSGQSTQAALLALNLAGMTAGMRLAAAAATTQGTATQTAGTAASTASGFFNTLTTAVNGVPTAHATTVTAPGLPETTAGMFDLQAAINGVTRAFTVTASVDISGALANIQYLNDHLPHSPAKTGPLSVLPNWMALFDTLPGAIDAATSLLAAFGTDAQKKLADTASSVAKAITESLTAIKALATFDFGSDSPSGGQVHSFAAAVGMIVQEIEWVASFFEDKGLKAATDFSDTASKVFGFFTNALAALKALPDLVVPSFAQVHAFALAVGLIVQEFQWVASFFKAEALKQAADFADSAGKVLDLVGKAVAAITALGAGPIKDVPFQAVHQLALTVGMIVQELQWVATFFAEKGLAQTALFAETAGKVLDTVTKAVAAVTALPDLADPGWEAVHRFAVVVGTIVQEIQWVATFFKDQALKSAADFSDSAGKVMGLFNEGIVGGLMKLAEFVAPSKLAIDNFLAVVFYVVQKFAEAASRLSTEGIKATTDFSNAAQAALNATKTGVDAFKDLTKLVVPSKEAIDNLLNAVRYVVDRMLDMANQMTNAGIERVTKFGTASSTVAKGITDVLDLFKKLGETPYKDMLSKGLAAVVADFNVALAAIQALAAQSQTFLNSALKFKDNMETAAAAIAAAAAAASAAQGTHIPALPSAPSAPSLPGGGYLPPPKIGHADGGWVVPGQEYRVGERGGETFVSAVPGYIVPHGAGGGGGGDTLKAEITLNLDGQKVTDVVYTRLLRMRRNKPSLGLS